jgi:aspartyl-tRNA(Asn)/glutamyl-tRNA(Gln) amidotransferase subunit B
VSVRPVGTADYGTKTELKNLGSFRSVQLGVAYEVERQTRLLEEGGQVQQETRGWNEQREQSFLMRTKETENDYRYFPDPDLSPLHFDPSEIEGLRAQLPELPLAKSKRYQEDLGLSEYDAGVLIADRAWSLYFEKAVEVGGDPKAICNWLTGDFAKLLNEQGIAPMDSKIGPKALVDLVDLIKQGTISGKIAKEIFPEMFETGRSPADLIEERGATQISDEDSIRAAVVSVFESNPDPVAKFRAGNANVKGFLVGQVMRATGGRANPGIVQQIVQEELEKQ